MDTLPTPAGPRPAPPSTPTGASRPDDGETFAPFGCPMGHGAATTDGSPTRPRKRGYFVPGMIALVAMVGIGAAVNVGGLDHRSPSRLAGPDVATFLAQGIQAQQGLASPPAITCPGSEPVRSGWSFTCRWVQGGTTHPVRVTETDAAGQFRFSVGPAAT